MSLDTAFAEAMQEANYLIAIDLKVEIKEQDSKRRVDWFPDFRIIDTATVTPDPETQARVDGYLKLLDDDQESTRVDHVLGSAVLPIRNSSTGFRSNAPKRANLTSGSSGAGLIR